MDHKIIALLPMKLHSERVPGKNFKPLGGKPLFRWILDTLLSINEIDAVVINTDAKQTLFDSGLVPSERIIIRDRKPNLCGDHVSMNDILIDDIHAVPAEHYLMTHTTNPLISSTTIKRAIGAYLNNEDLDSLFSVNKHQTRFYKQDVSPINHDPKNLIRTQDLEPWYEENSCIYLFNQNSFNQTKARIGFKPHVFVTPKLESIDIDEKEDWLLAEALIEKQQRAK
ncbi:MAG: acylneuraminate cytidylyltransferase family protein [Paraglaciecola sp.]|uniref:acylneuraminate cytidylyltransferase family protein n=2 Tax=Paraglaciecola sp. TaxID=1920173 RepID=UPI0032972A2A